VIPNDYGDVHAGYYNGDTYSRAEANDQKAFQIRGTLRPLPRMGAAKGLRLSVFYDADKPIQGGERNRFIAAGTFEHKYLNLGIDYLNAKDRSSPTKGEVKASGWTIWAQPRSLRASRDSSATTTSSQHGRHRFRPGGFGEEPVPGRALLLAEGEGAPAAAVLVDYEEVKYDQALAKPTEKRFEIKTLFNF